MKIIILAGGGGTRLYPLSTEARPKQFMEMGDGIPLVVSSVKRYEKFAGQKNIVVVTGEKYRSATKQALDEFDLKDVKVLCEPCRKNTAPAIAFAVRFLRDCLQCEEKEKVFVAACDHIILPEKDFINCLIKALDWAGSRGITLLGVQPTSPETGYGYIQMDVQNGTGLYEVKSFKEKPSFEVAKSYLRAGNYLWNSGMFAFTVEGFESQLKAYAPELYELYSSGYENFYQNFSQAPSVSFDTAISEKSDSVQVLPLECYWSDIGSFRSLYKTIKKLGRTEAALEIVKKSVAVLVIDDKRYAGNLTNFITSFKKFWPDCPFKVYLCTDEKDAFHEKDFLHIDKDRTFADNAENMTDTIDEPYLITFSADFFLEKKVEQILVDKAIDDFFSRDLSMLRLTHDQKGNEKIIDAPSKIQPPDKTYFSNRIALWDKLIYREFLQKGFWDWTEISNLAGVIVEGKLAESFSTVDKPVFN